MVDQRKLKVAERLLRDQIAAIPGPRRILPAYARPPTTPQTAGCATALAA
jgi:hypothetical protein